MSADEHLISLQPGTIIAGRYEVVKCLGAGSMGLVYACRHRELQGHLVAIKVLFPEVANDKVAAQRFRNEIFASYGVSHPNVVRAYEYIRDGDLIAYTMEYVGGGDLADRLSNEGALPIEDVVKLLKQMCLGVQAIHDAGIIHRDLKPENILLTEEGDVKIADFGIAKTGHGPKLTEHGGVVGTIDYVSPEYMLNSQVDWRSDIYAIGILAYEMTVGESPFKGDSVYATMTKRLQADPKPPSMLRSECPVELDKIILKAMARDPEQRYQSTIDMHFDLEILQRKLKGNITGEHTALLAEREEGEDAIMPNKKFSAPTHERVKEQLKKAEKEAEEIDDFSQKTVVAPLGGAVPAVEDPSDTFINKETQIEGSLQGRRNLEQASIVEEHTSGLSNSSFYDNTSSDSLNEDTKKEELRDTKTKSEWKSLINRKEDRYNEQSTFQHSPSPQLSRGGTINYSHWSRSHNREEGIPPLLLVVLSIIALFLGVGICFAVVAVFFPQLFNIEDSVQNKGSEVIIEEINF